MLEIRKRVLPKDHPDTLKSMHNLAMSLIKLDRGEEAIPLIDECVAKAAGQAVDPGLIPMVMSLRLGHFRKVGDPAGCRATAEMRQKLNLHDSESLYKAASFRTITAGVQAKTPGADAAGYKNPAHMMQDTDLDPLRERDEFKQLLQSLTEKQTPANGKENLP